MMCTLMAIDPAMIGILFPFEPMCELTIDGKKCTAKEVQLGLGVHIINRTNYYCRQVQNLMILSYTEVPLID